LETKLSDLGEPLGDAEKLAAAGVLTAESDEAVGDAEDEVFDCFDDDAFVTNISSSFIR
jgi:hypothetical protein